MDNLAQLALVILVCPLIGFVIQAFVGYRLGRQSHWIPTTAIFVPFLIACYMMTLLLGGDAGLDEVQRWPAAGSEPHTWISAGSSFPIHFGVYVDNLTVIMLFVVTLVSLLVHVYSMGYMKGEVRYPRFFAYLGLFSFSMLGLCISDSLLFVFIFWELVGLCSYFLIGFYFEKKSAQEASIKAFMTTRIGDLGFFAAILIIGSYVGSLEFGAIFESVQQFSQGAGPWTVGMGATMLVVAGIALLFGPIGKSAQFPLHIWLPDAMEGPTPVSALIHAATMVAAGVYLVGRMFPFLAGPEYFSGDFISSTPLLVIALVGGFTAFFAATIAFAQNDIKKVLAYSTISQLGYMFLGLGVGSLAAGLFHLMTHAFFKALLFLGSGSVIHAVHSNEMTDMGGLRKKMPITWITFGIGTLAIAGLPFLSGFYSKEMVLTQAYSVMQYHADSELAFLYKLPFMLGIVTAGMTCFYMFRLFFRTFHGKPQNEKAFSHAHESPLSMTIPLIVLAVLSVVSGGNQWIGESHHWFEDRVKSEVLVPSGAGGVATSANAAIAGRFEGDHSVVMMSSIAMFGGGLVLAFLFFTRFGPFYGKKLVETGPLALIHYCLVRLWFVDRILVGLALFLLHSCRRVCGLFDTRFVDGFVNGWASLCRFVTAVVGATDYWGVDGTVRGIGESAFTGGNRIRRLQNGYLQAYLYASVFLFAGVVVLSIYLMWKQVGSGAG